MKDMKITFTDTSRNFACWMNEKSSNILRELCCALQDIPSNKESDSFRRAVDDALKIYALCHGNLNGIYCDLVYALLMQYNISGYYFLCDLLDGTKKSSIMQDILQNKSEMHILELIEQNKKENRTAIAEQLPQITTPNNWTRQIANDIEFVHNGEQSWDWFYAKHGNDRNSFMLHLSGGLIQQVYEYFQSEEYQNADI